MDDFEDPADLDGDGEFDGIDIAFLEGENGGGKKEPVNGKSGCCVVLFLVGSSVGAGLWIGNYFI
jgi:hypothetical protein